MRFTLGSRQWFTNRRRPIIARVCALVMPLLMVGCATLSGKRTEPGDTHPRLGPTTYYEEGLIAFLGVDTNAACKSVKRDNELFPLAFVYVNKTKDNLRLTTESITLRDDAGTVYSLASYREFREKYVSRAAADNRLSESFRRFTNMHLGISPDGLAPYTQDPLPFYGLQGARSDRLELGASRFVRGLLFFPKPPGGLKGRLFELNVSSPDLADDIFVRFTIC
ncbi:MAG: hypothetical protein JSV80_09920 [Acidobacteriota bacterium]|nr:MAG: hypothetical protein JSV80_09920 [Acidobacteriota bacterium]